MEFENPESSRKIKSQIREIQNGYERMRKEISKVIVGQDEVVECVILALICDGHLLLEGVPGLAKSLLVESLARCVSGATFRRIQFVPDMLPADILGMNVFNPKTGKFYIVKGPIFANFILADEINRAPPKTQAALMEVMQERKVNIQKEEFILDKPFLVLATQNPIEQYGTYPLPEAIIDRFFMKILLEYPKVKDPALKENFFWMKMTVEGRPTFVLIHRMIMEEDGAYLAVGRHYYASQGYNAEQELGMMLPTDKGTLIVLLTRASSDAVAGFGTFSARERKGRIGVNPQNPSEKIQIPEVRVPKFKAGKNLKDALKK